eukprot:g3125.t1
MICSAADDPKAFPRRLRLRRLIPRKASMTKPAPIASKALSLRSRPSMCRNGSARSTAASERAFKRLPDRFRQMRKFPARYSAGGRRSSGKRRTCSPPAAARVEGLCALCGAFVSAVASLLSVFLLVDKDEDAEFRWARATMVVY